MLDTGASARQLWWLIQEGNRGETRPVSDAGQQGGQYNYNLGDATPILFGRIVDTAAIAHCYKVTAEKGSEDFPSRIALYFS